MLRGLGECAKWGLENSTARMENEQIAIKLAGFAVVIMPVRNLVVLPDHAIGLLLVVIGIGLLRGVPTVSSSMSCLFVSEMVPMGAFSPEL